MNTDIDNLKRELHEARETILALTPYKFHKVLRAYHCEPVEYHDKVSAAVLAADFGEKVSNAWDRRERYACPLCGEGQTVPAGMEMHVGVDGRGRMKLCKVIAAGIDLSREVMEIVSTRRKA